MLVQPELISRGGLVIKRPLIVLIRGRACVNCGRNCSLIFPPEVIDCIASGLVFQYFSNQRHFIRGCRNTAAR
jgi:hypothetical protein